MAARRQQERKVLQLKMGTQKQKSNFLVIAKATLLFIWSLHHSQRACVRARSETKSARVFFRRTDEREKVRQPLW
ncbi:hypothetical protein D4764_09G0009640 [Takifugu flavidus]|uniref:Uncharacterized protein n=1 Tax=Takifugu flavidus TaxID=433684 RepID=A0A5C6ML33_9TELE|nr:hypothetical protein D4764_09G0009640 [Takifugu flavidus]